MNPEQLSDAMNELPQELLEETQAARSRRRLRWKPLAAAAACLLLAAGAWALAGRPAEPPPAPEPGDLPVLTIDRDYGGMGDYPLSAEEFAAYDGGPWQEGMELAALPVFRNTTRMDVANGFADGGIHVGTEDMSEFADGWCTYNGDHISMYDVNAGSTKTMVQMVVRYVAETTDDQVLAKALLDVLDTPVSPELLPPTRNGEIAQKSEDSVGPYNLQDFFLYYLVDHGFAPEKVLRLADIAYGDEFDHATLKKWLRSYCRRLFSQQFKRSCLQDGPTLNGFSFSPRTGFSMPSDGSDALYLATVDALK